MPGKTLMVVLVEFADRFGFNEAPAKCRGKRFSPDETTESASLLQ